jgi:hypothetical protein
MGDEYIALLNKRGFSSSSAKALKMRTELGEHRGGG